MPNFKSKREDGRGHKPPLSYSEQSKTFAIKVPVSMWNELKNTPREIIREYLKSFIEK